MGSWEWDLGNGILGMIYWYGYPENEISGIGSWEWDVFDTD